MLDLQMEGDENRIAELLIKIGITEAAAKKLSPFMSQLAQAYQGLVAKGMDATSSHRIYTVALLGYLASNPDVEAEFVAIREDPVKLAKCMAVIAETTKAVMDEIQKVREEVTPSDEVTLNSTVKATLH